METTLHRYEPQSLAGDYVRAVAGMVICFTPLLFIETGSVMVYVLTGLGLIFTVFGARTAIRHATTVELSAQGLKTFGVVRRELAWQDLKGHEACLLLDATR